MGTKLPKVCISEDVIQDQITITRTFRTISIDIDDNIISRTFADPEEAEIRMNVIRRDCIKIVAGSEQFD